ncbi:S9 family peptidase [Chitinophaga solisilvae]|uniref:S9 family peptidase n=1 Tax=Chitinophaga solisilvae TaxID=1233460 RepID=UPI00136CF055|nr:DPP IV N-terminal domain-containing protein [Chitinophaga solisilvae]
MTTANIIRGFLIAAGLSAAMSALSQDKGKKYVVPLPVVGSWTDNHHFVLLHRDGPLKGKNILTDAATGKQTGEAPARPYGKQHQLIVSNNDIYIVNGRTKKQLTHDSTPEYNPVFSPDSNYIAFTRYNNLYTLELATGKEVQLTHDGSDVIMNGYASWVYMEEILGRDLEYRAFWWSPDSKSLAFFRTDDSKVPLFTLTDVSNGKSILETQRYPCPGDTNPSVKIGMVAAAGGPITWAAFDENTDQYFGTPYWYPDSKSLMVQWLNRGQDHYQLYRVAAATGSRQLAYEERQPSWINLDEAQRLTFVNGGKALLLISDQSGYRQIYLHRADGVLLNRVTSGDFVVKEILYVDERKQVVYFTGNKEGLNRQDLYRVDFNGRNQQRLTFGPYSHQATMSPDASYFITRYGNAGTPERLALMNNRGKILQELANSQGPDYDSTIPKASSLVYVPSEDNKFRLPMRVTLPANLQPGKKYPVIIAVYGGPASSNVSDTWSPLLAYPDWQDRIIVYMDHRGSEEFGKAGQQYMHRDLARWPVRDWTQCVKWLLANTPADPEKIIITGHSFGGYITCHALMQAPEYFKFGIAGGTVADWRMYDSHYTERYMDTPAENPEGYRSSSVLTYTDKLKGKLLLIHGMSDDNVHAINTLELADQLQRKRNMNFSMMLYPGARHSMFGPGVEHYSKLTSQYQDQWLSQKP